MSGKDEVCYIQRLEIVDEVKYIGRVHLRLRDTGKKRFLLIHFQDRRDFSSARAIFRRHKTFFLKPDMRDDKVIRWQCRGSEMRSYQNTDWTVNSLLYKMAMEQIKEKTAELEKITKEKDNAQRKLREYIEERKIEDQRRRREQIEKNNNRRLAEQLRRTAHEKQLERQVKRQDAIIADLIFATEPNNGQNREQENMFFGFQPR